MWAAPQSFVEDEALPYRCTRCDAGRLSLEWSTLELINSVTGVTDSVSSRSLKPGEADRFSCLLRCANPDCEDVVRCEGDVGWDETVRWDEDEGDWDVSISPLYKPKVMESQGVSLHLTPNDAAGTPLDEPGEVTVDLQLEPTDSLILSHLRRRPTERLITSDIANQLRLKEKSIGKNLAKLVRAGLIDNVRRFGYRITSFGERISSEIDGS